ncbi:Lrp/AsnC family transcriptional regulator [Blastococcus goldschmidtiae]|uniref:Lrp/AsnC family transcriptional regulator n=1 Tax=Blastococcus goldschmidtiae TaxID=3075546 RepID=A0ABU2K6V0_9ACTN|nr:Lrp/AsnC family transcriptional regulator [Blastococcus sp. DSM 46792]MDT0275922.1 Lrp/AsnC family transcriptional regulator [Blastococcus sp. DSM 46792]
MDALDLELVNALQMRPRAPWAEVAEPLGIDPATVSRRWARLSESGAAWVTCYPGNRQIPYGCVALVEVTCVAGSVLRVAEQVAAHPHALSVDVCSGSRDLFVTVATASVAALARYVGERLGTLPDVVRTETSLATRGYREASRWRLDSLDAAQRIALAGSRDSSDGRTRIPEEDWELLLALGVDGRMSLTELSERTGQAQSTVRRRLDRLLASDRAVLRCDFAHVLAGWQLPAVLWLTVPAPQLHATAQRLCALPEARACWATTGPANLCLYVWLHTPQHLEQVAEHLLQHFPGLQIRDTSAVLRVIKRTGRLLDADGRCVGQVPMDLWRDPVEGQDPWRATGPG